MCQRGLLGPVVAEKNLFQIHFTELRSRWNTTEINEDVETQVFKMSLNDDLLARHINSDS